MPGAPTAPMILESVSSTPKRVHSTKKKKIKRRFTICQLLFQRNETILIIENILIYYYE